MKPGRNQIIQILKSDDEALSNELFEEARRIRKEVFADKIFMYGFVYFTTWCRNDCTFCYYRKSNSIDRYRKSPDEIISLAGTLADSGVHMIDLTMGEDEIYHEENFRTVTEIIKKIKAETGLPVMISPGVVSDETIRRFKEAGCDWYALYQETHNRELFAKRRINQSYDERMHAKLYAKAQGMLIEEGIMTGIGESAEDIADSLIEMGRTGASQIRVMSFVPQKGSPMENVKTPDRSLEMKIIALMRIMYPHALIPMSLDVDGIAGLRSRAEAGGNVVTSIIPPKTGLAGVAQGSMDVDEGGRTVEEATGILKEMGLAVATKEEYREYLKRAGERQCRR